MNPSASSPTASGSKPDHTAAGNGSDAPDRKQRPMLVSCAECRRSKLKCDKNVPCSSCQKRGCAHLCPTGVLPATKGNKALEVKASKLADRNKELTAKVEELNEALKQAKEANEKLRMNSSSHPLAEENETSREPDAEHNIPHLAEAVGSLAIDETGVATYYGSTTSSEVRVFRRPCNSRTTSSADHRSFYDSTLAVFFP